MSNKYYGRSQSIISRDHSSNETDGKEPSWFADFVNNLDKAATKSKKDDFSLFDQINNILGNKSKYSNVEEAVKDMAKRTGLSDMLNKKKQAQLSVDEKNKDSKFLNEIPELKTFIDNYIEDHHGTSVDAVIHDLLKIKSIKDKLPEDDAPLEIVKYINDKIMEIKMQNQHPGDESFNLGKADLSTDDNVVSDNDPFGGCEPDSASK